jgi:2-haloacid dehalogenase
MEIKHIVFDIGNVLIEWDAELAFLDQIPDTGERRWFLDNVCTMAWNIEQDRGRDWKEAEEILIVDFPEHEDNIRAFRKNWPSMLAGQISGSVEILRAFVSRGHDVTMLTNFASDTLEIAKARYDFLGISRGMTVSADIGLLKPDIEIYRHHSAEYGLSPGHTLFIDDTMQNVDGAIQAGWNAVQFKDAETLKADLERFRFDQ